MKEGFRQAMAWLHTWIGLIFGWLLFAIFLTGTLSYFKDEITHWAQPEVRRHTLDPASAGQGPAIPAGQCRAFRLLVHRHAKRA